MALQMRALSDPEAVWSTIDNGVKEAHQTLRAQWATISSRVVPGRQVIWAEIKLILVVANAAALVRSECAMLLTVPPA